MAKRIHDGLGQLNGNQTVPKVIKKYQTFSISLKAFNPTLSYRLMVSFFLNDRSGSLLRIKNQSSSFTQLPVSHLPDVLDAYNVAAVTVECSSTRLTGGNIKVFYYKCKIIALKQNVILTGSILSCTENGYQATPSSHSFIQ